jgi:hypothetical protein
MATMLADDCCRELFYSAATKQDILNAIKQFNKNTVLIPVSILYFIYFSLKFKV